MRDGRYIVEYVTQDPFDSEQRIRIGEYEIEHDWVIEVDGSLEDEVKTGPVTPEVEDLLERGYNNGYYQTRPVSKPDEEMPKRRTPTWSAV